PGPAASPPPTRGSAATVRRKDVRCSGQSQAGTGSSASAGARLRARAAATWSGGASGPGRSTVTSGSATATSASATIVARGQGREQAGRVWSDAEVTGGEDIDIRLDITPLGSRPGKLGEGRVGKRRIREREATHYACAEAGEAPGRRRRHQPGRGPKPGAGEPGGETEGCVGIRGGDDVTGVEGDLRAGGVVSQGEGVEPAGQIRPNDPIRSRGTPRPKESPGRPALIVCPGPEPPRVRRQMSPGSSRQLGQ